MVKIGQKYRALDTSKTQVCRTQSDKIAIGTCKAVSFVSVAEQSTWLPCGIGVFIFCVCSISGGDDAASGEKENFGSIL